MTELDQRIAIAEWEGYEIVILNGKQSLVNERVFGNCDGYPIDRLPQYDLNEMHEVEETLTEDQWSTYSVTLNEIACRLHGCGHVNICGYTLAATAAQRREAFLRTIGKWKDSN